MRPARFRMQRLPLRPLLWNAFNPCSCGTAILDDSASDTDTIETSLFETQSQCSRFSTDDDVENVPPSGENIEDDVSIAGTSFAVSDRLLPVNLANDPFSAGGAAGLPPLDTDSDVNPLWFMQNTTALEEPNKMPKQSNSTNLCASSRDSLGNEQSGLGCRENRRSSRETINLIDFFNDSGRNTLDTFGDFSRTSCTDDGNTEEQMRVTSQEDQEPAGASGATEGSSTHVEGNGKISDDMASVADGMEIRDNMHSVADEQTVCTSSEPAQQCAAAGTQYTQAGNSARPTSQSVSDPGTVPAAEASRGIDEAGLDQLLGGTVSRRFPSLRGRSIWSSRNVSRNLSPRDWASSWRSNRGSICSDSLGSWGSRWSDTLRDLDADAFILGEDSSRMPGSCDQFPEDDAALNGLLFSFARRFQYSRIPTRWSGPTRDSIQQRTRPSSGNSSAASSIERRSERDPIPGRPNVYNEQHWYFYDPRLTRLNQVQRLNLSTEFGGIHNEISLPGIISPPPYEEIETNPLLTGTELTNFEILRNAAMLANYTGQGLPPPYPDDPPPPYESRTNSVRSSSVEDSDSLLLDVDLDNFMFMRANAERSMQEDTNLPVLDGDETVVNAGSIFEPHTLESSEGITAESMLPVSPVVSLSETENGERLVGEAIQITSQEGSSSPYITNDSPVALETHQEIEIDEFHRDQCVDTDNFQADNTLPVSETDNQTEQVLQSGEQPDGDGWRIPDIDSDLGLSVVDASLEASDSNAEGLETRLQAHFTPGYRIGTRPAVRWNTGHSIRRWTSSQGWMPQL